MPLMRVKLTHSLARRQLSYYTQCQVGRVRDCCQGGYIDLDYARIMNQVRSASHSIYALQPRSVPSHTLCKVDTVIECLSLLIHDKVALAVAVTLGACIDELLAQLSLPAFLLGLFRINLGYVRAPLLLHRSCILLHLLQLELPSLLLAFLVFFSVAC